MDRLKYNTVCGDILKVLPGALFSISADTLRVHIWWGVLSMIVDLETFLTFENISEPVLIYFKEAALMMDYEEAKVNAFVLALMGVAPQSMVGMVVSMANLPAELFDDGFVVTWYDTPLGRVGANNHINTLWVDDESYVKWVDLLERTKNLTKDDEDNAKL